MRVTWCDKLASQPSIGLLLDPFYGGNETVLTRIAPLFEKWGTLEKPGFQVSVPDIFKVDVQRDDGFHYSFDATKAAVQFQHRMKFRPVSGGLPVAELISSPQVFTSLLDTASRELVEFTLQLPEIGRRAVRRVGVVSTTAVSEEDLPPGIQRLVEYVARPWPGGMETYNFNMTTKLYEHENYWDRCIHSLVLPEDEDALLTLRFDWQRILKKKQVASRRELDRLCASAIEDALSYFEELAVGNAFDV